MQTGRVWATLAAAFMAATIAMGSEQLVDNGGFDVVDTANYVPNDPFGAGNVWPWTATEGTPALSATDFVSAPFSARLNYHADIVLNPFPGLTIIQDRIHVPIDPDPLAFYFLSVRYRRIDTEDGELQLRIQAENNGDLTFADSAVVEGQTAWQTTTRILDFDAGATGLRISLDSLQFSEFPSVSVTPPFYTATVLVDDVSILHLAPDIAGADVVLCPSDGDTAVLGSDCLAAVVDAGGIVTWTSTDSRVGFDDIQAPNPTVTVPEGTDAIITATIQSFGQVFTFTSDVHIVRPALNPVMITGPTKPMCAGQTAILGAVAPEGRFDLYEWSTGETTASITINSPGEYSVTVTDEFGCKQTAYFIVPSAAISLDLGADIVICNDAPLPLLGTGLMSGGRYSWDFYGTDGTIETRFSNLSMITPFPVQSGTYCLTVIDKDGCTAVDCIDVTIQRPLSPAIVVPKIVCEGVDVCIQADVGTSVIGSFIGLWNLGTSASPTTSNAGQNVNQVCVEFTEPGPAEISYTAINSCGVYTTTASFTVVPASTCAGD